MDVTLSTIGVLVGICALLALLLVIAERIFIRTGPVTITINDGAPMQVEGGGTVLSTLKEKGVFIPSACGGRGSCGMCKARITKGGGPLLPTELPHLSEEEKAAGVRLTCQLKVRTDIALEIPPEFLEVEEHAVRVSAVEALNYDTRRVTLTFDADAGFTFIAGQYVQFEIPIYDGLPAPVQRAYSIASAPGRPRSIDLIIRQVPHGIATTFIHELLQPEDKLKINGPYGEFRLRDTPAEAVFIAGGSGLAPFEAILEELAEKGTEKKITLFFGAVTGWDLYDLEKMRRFEEAIPTFTFVPALSRPREEDRWEGATGLVTEVVRDHYASTAGMEGYLCGSPGMIDACIEVLTDRGMDGEKIYYDKFS